MRKLILINVAVILLLGCNNSDHETIQIGNQTWMAENLNVDKFRNGDPIPEAQSVEDWKIFRDNREPAWCYYNMDSKNEKKFGKLYNWYAIADPRGLAPEGWHLPSNEDWWNLNGYLGLTTQPGTAMKSSSGWSNNGNGTNKSGFNGLPGGYLRSDGRFLEFGSIGNWWSLTSRGSEAWAYYLWSIDDELNQKSRNKGNGLYVRCLRN